MKNYVKRPFIGLIITCIFLLVIGCSSSSSHSVPAKPNIVLIYMDDMGYGDLECYGHPTIKTPNLNALAASGIRFTSFYAPATVCTPSRAGLLTGRYPVRHTPNNFGPESEKGMPLEEITIAQVLKQVGYHTACIGKWHLGHKTPYLPTFRGFDKYYGLPYSNDMILPWCPWLSEEDKLFMYQDTLQIEEVGKHQKNLITNFSDKAIEFIQSQDNEPFFLYLAHSMPHLPISAPDDFVGTSLAGLYGDVIETVDWTVGQIINVLREQKIADNTLVIFTSDNGPWHNLPDRMLQDGNQPWHTGTAGMLRGAKATTYEGGQRVPAIMAWPGRISGGKINREIVTGLDIFPTLVNLAGAELPDVELDGLDILSVIMENKSSPRNTFFYCQGHQVQAVRQNEWKLRMTTDEGVQLFNLNIDPSEMYNRADEFPNKASELIELISEFAQETQSEFALD